jgi:8-oxo-dGTP diphosphatase
MNYGDIDWNVWRPVERATLMLVICGGRILLIHKKRGLGAGKFNGPGGRIEPGETPYEAAMREVEEELGIIPSGVRLAGELQFQFVDGHGIHGYVFVASQFQGEPRETDEAVPFWFSLDAIPYHNMWADDRIWVPLALEGKPFTGRFLFDGDQMLGCELMLQSQCPQGSVPS